MSDLSYKQMWRRRALSERPGGITPSMEKILQMQEAVDSAREKVGDQAFDLAARSRYWGGFWKNFLAGVVLFVLAIVSFPLVYPMGVFVAVASTAAISLVAVHFWSKCWTCAACGGNSVRRLPIYCHQCGATYLFHRAGRWLFERQQAAIDKWVKAEMERKFGHERRLPAAADKIASDKEALGPEERARLSEILDQLDKLKPPK